MHKNQRQNGDFYKSIALLTKMLEAAMVVAMVCCIATSTQIWIGY